MGLEQLEFGAMINDPAVVLDLLSKETAQTFMLVEAFGSIGHPLVRSFMRYSGFDDDEADKFRKLVPNSRGGEGRGIEVEQRWESLMDEIRRRNGTDVFDRARRTVEGEANP